MDRWGGGYVTDIAYTTGYYRQQSPFHLSVACLLGNVAGLGAGLGESLEGPLSYVELGCGQGLNALLQAACNPRWTVTAIDFHPAHIAAARAFAAAADLANVTFVEADLAGLADGPDLALVPEADVITLHGLWSWVSAEVRAGIVRLAAQRLRPGGILHVSYNALPAWQGALGMQRVLREAGLRLAGRSDRQARAGLQVVQELTAADARHVKSNALVQSMIERVERLPLEYLAHEYMNGAWNPCFHADVVAAMAAAKLDWVASANLTENFPELSLTEAQREIVARFDDAPMRELIKDMCLQRGLRQDVFVRGARRLGDAARDAALREVTLALTREPAAFVYAAEMPAGTATLAEDYYRPVVEFLAEGPRRVGEVLALPALAGRRQNPAELVGMLVGTEQAIPVSARGGRPSAAAQRFNRAAAGRLVGPDLLSTTVGIASDALGSPMPSQILELFVHARLQDGAAPDGGADAGPASWAAELAPGHDPAEQARLRDFLARILAERAPFWQRLHLL